MSELVGPRAVVTNVTNPKEYEKTRSGTALHVIVSKLSDAGVNIIARGTRFTWQYEMEQEPIPEYNTRMVQEIVSGKTNMGRGTIATIEVMKINDALPTYKDLPLDEEYLILQVTGDNEAIPGQVLNAFLGAKCQGRGGEHGGSGFATQNVPFVFRKHLTGADWKKLNPSAQYPAEVQ